MTGAAGATIRAAERRDLDGLMRLEEEAFPGDRLGRRDLLHAIRSPTILALAAECEGALAGYVLVQIRRGSTLGRLTSVAVAQAAAGRGVGRALVAAAERAALEAGCDRMRLEVRADNARAARLYEAGGYGVIGEVADYYEDGEAARRLEKRLAA
ncbi:GNAT family N-acetyltransferase [Enterovirga sp.]|uniref:GNAT family N-acetyltransferase n=1 Tax=Enterovirga sp. TaxID=2026350 RepID=UPI0026267BF4|nr:GNAT family N-acetyltransferase [Enterovirga sp.]MDB5590819.1 N-acetyltransferase [Enterovirga sp.]